MKFNIDFTLIITLLVMAELYISNISVKPKKRLNEEGKVKNIISSKGLDRQQDELILVAHQANGEENSYSTKIVA